MFRLSRRKLLSLTAIGISSGLAGCSDTSVSSDTTVTGITTPVQQTQTTTHDQDGSAGPAPSCPGEYSSFTPGWVVEGSGPLAGFNLTTDQQTIAVGDTLTVSLRNVTNTTQMTGSKPRFDVQYRSSNGWHTILGTKGDVVWHPIGIEHEPDQGFTWQFNVTRDGLSRLTEQYGVCTPITPGTYRFVYWGITTEQEEAENYGTDYAISTSFTVTDDQAN